MVGIVGIRQMMRFVMLESAKDRVIGVDTSGQQVLPCVRYEMTYLLIRKTLVSMSCRKHGTDMAIPTRPQGARGAMRVFCCTQEGEEGNTQYHSLAWMSGNLV
jgi:hypothetical protein